MFKRKNLKLSEVDVIEEPPIPPDGHHHRPTSYRPVPDDLHEQSDRDFLWEEGDPADRRRDPLRKP